MVADNTRDFHDYFNRYLDLNSTEDSSDDPEDSSDELEDSPDELEDSPDELEDSTDSLEDSIDSIEPSSDDSEDESPGETKLKDFRAHLRCQRRESLVEGDKTHALYDYKGLPKDKNTIRVLTIEPAREHHAQLRGSLRIVDLRQPPKYQAISYRWSDDTPDCNIEIGNSILITTRSAGIALKRVRDRVKKVTVWIDAVCIDQLDRVERGQQVELIGRIFKQAEKVLVWLDGNSEHAEDAFKLVEDLHGITKWPSYNDSSKAKLVMGSELKERVLGPECKNLSRLLEHEWFSRLWAVPEVGLATTVEVLCGRFSIAWHKLKFADDLLTALCVITQKRLYIRPPVMAPTSPNSWSEKRENFHQVLKLVRECRVSDPRDRVFALLGHPSATKFSITPDYSKPKLQVFLETTIAILKFTRRLEVLGMAQHESEVSYQELQQLDKQPRSKFPTWAPRWDRLPDICLFNNSTHYSSGTGRKSEFSLESGDRELLVRGICFDSIIFHSKRLHWNEMWPKSREAVRSFQSYQNPIMGIWEDMDSQVDDPFRQYGSEGEAWRAYCNTLTAENCHWRHSGRSNYWVSQTHSKNPLDALPSLFTYRQEWELLPDTYRANRRPKLDPKSASEGALLFLQHYAAVVCDNRKFFMTTYGNYGLGPMAMRPGDKVCILFGMNVPVVLRSSGESWQLVGECYVNGIMHGEATDKWKKGKLRSHVFRII